MTQEQKRTIELKLAAVSAEAASLADDLRNNRLWEGDCLRRIGNIQENLNEPKNQAQYDK